MLKRFCLGCSGVFLLVLSFHFGATTAQSHASSTGWFLEGNSGGPYVLTVSGDLWRYVPGYGWLADPGNIFGAAAGTRTIVSVGPGLALTSSGEVWYGPVHAGPWTNSGEPPLGPTPATQQSFGGLKTRYR